MTVLKYLRPSVPGGSNVPALGSRQGNMKAEGAKNHRVSCQGFYVGTYNCRTLSSEEKLLELLEELENIKWDIIGLSEVRRKGEDLIELKNGHLFYFRGTESGKCGGIGFLINRKFKNNIAEINSSSDRLGRLVVQVSKRYQIQIIQVYAPTTSYTNDQVEEFYAELHELNNKTNQQFKIIMGDFNARIGSKQQKEYSVGNFGFGKRDERGHRLVEFAEGENFKIMNSFFQKHRNRKWTWRSPSGGTSEIDYVMANRKYVVTDCSVLNRFNAGSDHRMVRCKININIRRERQKLLQNKQNKINLINLKTKSEEFKIELKNHFDVLNNISEEDINERNTTITKGLIEVATKVAGTESQTRVTKISDKTKKLMQKRREMKIKKDDKRAKIEYTELCKCIRKCIKEDIRKYNCDIVQKAIENNKSLKYAKRTLAIGKKQIHALKTKHGEITTNRNAIIKEAVDFYSNLYKSEDRECSINKDDVIPSILKDEIRLAIKQMKKGKTPGEDKITAEILKEGGEECVNLLGNLFNSCIEKCDIPDAWKNAIMILLHKKGEKEDIRNYRPISLLSIMYKVFTKILTNRLQKPLDAAQPKEQAGFRSGFSTIDHIHTLREIIERTNEYELPLCVAFIDYEKAFDSVKTSAVIKALTTQDINSSYATLINNIYNEATAKLRLHKDSENFRIGKGVRQGDTISPKLFNAVLEEVFKKLHWDNQGIKINGEYLNHLRFADDVVIFAQDSKNLQDMVQELSSKSKEVGLKINLKKTKVLFNNFVEEHKILLEGAELEIVNDYVYLGQKISLGGNIMEEINHRVKLAWTAFGRNSMIFKGNLPLSLKRKVFDQCILPTLTYASETWTLTKKAVQKLQTTQRSMERCMMGFTRLDKMRCAWIRKRTKVTDVIERIKRLKWNWAGHIARTTDDRWILKVLHWCPRENKRPRKRPHNRWRDEIRKFAGIDWWRKAQSRKNWKSLREAFILQWIDNG